MAHKVSWLLLNAWLLSGPFILQAQVLPMGQLKEQQVQITLPQNIKQGDTFTLHATYTLPEGLYMQADSSFMKLSLISDETFTVQDLGVTLLSQPKVTASGDKFIGEVRFAHKFKLIQAPASGQLTVVAHHQLCNEEGLCYLPQTFTLSETLHVSTAGFAFGQAMLWLALVFLGGLVLNLMPCVLPLLMFKLRTLSTLVPAQRRSHLTFYSFGVIASSLVLAFIVILVQHMGQQFGLLLYWQSPLFMLFMMILLISMALNLMGFYAINPPHWAGKVHSQGGPFLQGMVLVLLASACSAPFLSTAMAFALAQPSLYILAAFLVLGVGLATPMIVLMALPWVQPILTKSERFTHVIAQVSGFVLFVLGIWLSRLLCSQFSGPFIVMIPAVLVLFWFGYDKVNTSDRLYRFRKAYLLGGLLLIGLGLMWGYNRYAMPVAVDAVQVTDDRYEAFSNRRLAELQEQGVPVFVSFGAAWCLTCEMNERLVLKSERVQTFFKAQGIVWLKADVTYNTPHEVAVWMNALNKSGLPVYFYSNSEGAITPLSEFITPSTILKLK